MPTIEKQLELEQNMIDSGAEQYLKMQRNAEETGRGHELDYSRRLMKEFMLPLIEELKKWLAVKGPARLGKARTLIDMATPEAAVFIALRGIFSSFTQRAVVAGVASGIGKMIEDEVRFSRFAESHDAYYKKIMDDFKRKGTKDYRFMHRVLTHQANDYQIGWVAWTPVERVLVGTKLIDLILENTDLIKKVERKEDFKNVTEIHPTEESLRWIKAHEGFKQLMYPNRTPCVIPPDPWVSVKQGGYYSPGLRSGTPMVQNRGKLDLSKYDLSRVMDSINKTQEVPWAVNQQILAVVKDVWRNNLQIGMPGTEQMKPSPCPVEGIKVEEMTPEQKELFDEWKREASAIYTADRERVSKTFQVSRIVRLATDYAQYDNFWYVWYADFRGRLYTATAGFSPQGPDLAKGLLRFGRGLPLGDRGFYWLCVHGANRYGYDKSSYDDRVKWVADRHESFLAAANDPLSHRDVWANADKPWQFLAFLVEYASVFAHESLGIDRTKFVSYLPIGLDGSCNGLQNFSAMLRDPVGGRATNLSPGDRPADIYAEVAKVTLTKVERMAANTSTLFEPQLDGTDAGYAVWKQWRDDCEFPGKWLSFGLDRKVAKRPVMTLPYGSTRQSATQYIYQEILKRDKKHFSNNFAAAVWLTGIMWKSIGEVVVAAAEAMQWLQKCASAMNKIDAPIQWTTADGFVAYQESNIIDTVKIDTQLAGRFQIRVGTHSDKLDYNKQRSGISPNFVHSQDATHLRMTVRNLAKAGIKDIALIHDDYGTHACNTDIMHRVIRETFVELYRDNDPLAAFAEACEAAGAVPPKLPKRGSLRIEDVLDSRYFFG